MSWQNILARPFVLVLGGRTTIVENNKRCQLHCWPEMSEGPATTAPLSPRKSLKLLFKRLLSAKTKRRLKKRYTRLRAYFSRPQPPPAPAAAVTPAVSLEVGDRVRVRSRAEIEASLDMWGESRGCGFMADMWDYCDTEQQVLKPVRQFLDERDYRLKKTSGMVVLQNVICQGMPEYGTCDRACHFFWRNEWLEKLD